MPTPFNYATGGMNPVDAMFGGMEFGQRQRQGEQDMLAGRQKMELAEAQEGRAVTEFGQKNTLFDQGQQDRQAAQANAQKLQGDLLGLSEKVLAGKATSNDFTAIAAQHPDLIDEMAKMWEGQATERKDADVANIFKAATAIKAGRPQIAIDMLEERATAADASGDKQEADIARAMAETIKIDPNAGLTTLGLLLQAVDGKASVELFGAGADRDVQSTKAYDNGTTVTVFTDGSKEVTDAAGKVMSEAAAIEAIAAAQANEAEAKRNLAAGTAEGRLETEIAIGGEAAATVESGKQAIAKSGEAFDSLNKVKANIVNVNTAIEALNRGANAGAIAKYFPNITEASASLENAMNKLGLDVIGSVTFGALSEGEMKLAMETAVPRNLNDADLKQWLIGKKAAQEKAAEALRAAAIYLGTPGNTLAKWLVDQPTTAPAAGSGSQEQSDQKPQSADDILREIEGL